MEKLGLYAGEQDGCGRPPHVVRRERGQTHSHANIAQGARQRRRRKGFLLVPAGREG